MIHVCTAVVDQSGDSTRGFLLLIIATLTNGTTWRLSSTASTDWLYRHGPIVYDHNWHGEIYDRYMHRVLFEIKITLTPIYIYIVLIKFVTNTLLNIYFFIT